MGHPSPEPSTLPDSGTIIPQYLANHSAATLSFSILDMGFDAVAPGSLLIFTLCKYTLCIIVGNEKKNRLNLRLHGIAFEDAARIFEGPTVERTDERFDYGERRIYAIGVVNGLEITVIYTDRGEDERRIISAWRSEPHERRHYWRTIEESND